jgi:hypothetical protein
LVKQLTGRDQTVIIGDGLIRIRIKKANGRATMVIDAPDDVKVRVLDADAGQDSSGLAENARSVVSPPRP